MGINDSICVWEIRRGKRWLIKGKYPQLCSEGERLVCAVLLIIKVWLVIVCVVFHSILPFILFYYCVRFTIVVASRQLKIHFIIHEIMARAIETITQCSMISNFFSISFLFIANPKMGIFSTWPIIKRQKLRSINRNMANNSQMPNTNSVTLEH